MVSTAVTLAFPTLWSKVVTLSEREAGIQRGQDHTESGPKPALLLHPTTGPDELHPLSLFPPLPQGTQPAMTRLSRAPTQTRLVPLCSRCTANPTRPHDAALPGRSMACRMRGRNPALGGGLAMDPAVSTLVPPPLAGLAPGPHVFCWALVPTAPATSAGLFLPAHGLWAD